MRSKKMLILLILVMVMQTMSLSGWSGKVEAAFSGGDGSEDNPYIIETAQQLSNIRDDLSAHYKLGADIDLTGYDHDDDGSGWLPIGGSTNRFTGTLDGNGYAIKNMTINRPSMNDVGLFASTQSGSQLINIRLLDVQVIGDRYVGGLAGVSTGTIQSSFATGRVSGNEFIGGLVGQLVGVIEQSYAVVNVNGQGQVGGLVGTLYGAIRNSYAAGHVAGHVYGSTNVGGLVGLNDLAVVSASYAVGSVKGESLGGGLVGNRFGRGITQDSYWNTQTTGQSASAGGIGITSAEMKDPDTFSNWDPEVWGVRDGETFPYLRAFGMGFGVDPLALSTYSLHPGQDALSVTGAVYHETSGEPITITYDILNEDDDTVASMTTTATTDGNALPINARLSLVGFDNGDYLIMMTAQDSRHTVVGATLAFQVDTSASAPPSVTFGTNGDENWSRTASTTVTVDGEHSPFTQHYVWSTDQVTPSSGWETFDSGDTLTKDEADGDWYLHIRATDAMGNTAHVVSNRFRLDSSSAVLSGLTLSEGSLSPVFAEGTTAYTANVPNGVSAIAVTPTAAHETDTVTVSVNDGDSQTVISGEPSEPLALNEGENTIAVTVTALNDERTTYTVTVHRMLPPTVTFGTNGNENWSRTASTTVTVDGEHSPFTQHYVWSTEQATPSSGWEIFDSGDTLAKDEADGDWYLHIRATDAMGNTAYIVSDRFRLDSSSAVLRGLTLSEGNLDPAFAEGTTAYTANVPNGVSAIAVTPTAAYATGTVTVSVNGGAAQTVTSGEPSESLALNEGENTIAVTVTALNGEQTTYTVTVYAQWTPTPAYTVTYNGNGNTGGSVPSDPHHYAPGDTVTVQDNIGSLTRSGYTFAGWNTQADGTGTSYAAGSTFAMGTDDVTLYAQWTVRSSGGVGSPPPSCDAKITSANGTITLPACRAGEVSLGEAATVLIPARTFDRALTLTINEIKDTQPLLTEGDRLLSPVFEIEKSTSDPFNQAATLILAFDPSSLKENQLPVVFYYDEAMKEWVEMAGGRIEDQRIAVEIDHVAKFAVFAVDQEPTAPIQKPEQPEMAFSDIAGHWAEDSIRQAVIDGIVAGYPDGTFRPDHPVTRAEFTVMLAAALKWEGTGATLPFIDQDKIGDWAKRAVALAVQTGIVSGYEDGSFRPDARITRAEMALMIARALKVPLDENIPTGFADDEHIPSWARGAVEAIRELGIVNGRGGNLFVPNGTATRAEAVAMILRMLEQKG